MILSLIWSAAVYAAGTVTGVYLREHNVVTVADIRQAADKLIAAAPSVSPRTNVPEQQTQQA